MTTRINPETGVIEEKHWLFGWEDRPNENERAERVNTETGVIEEKHWLFGWDKKD